MTTGRVFIAASLDGFIARKDGDIEWLTSLPPDEGGDYGYSPFLETVDGLVMGRGSFEKVATFELWPYPKPVVVLSRSMTQADIPAHLAGKVTVSAKTPREIMAELTERGWAGAYIDGGQVVQSFLREGLIEDLIISHIPILLGSGIPLFGALDADIRLDHVETKSFASGLVQSHYRVTKKAA